MWGLNSCALHDAPAVVFLQSECLAHMGESLIRLKNFTAAAEMLDKAIECLSSGTVWNMYLFADTLSGGVFFRVPFDSGGSCISFVDSNIRAPFGCTFFAAHVPSFFDCSCCPSFSCAPFWWAILLPLITLSLLFVRAYVIILPNSDTHAQKKLSGVEAHIEVLLGLCAVETNSFRAAADHFLKSLRLATSVGIGLRSGETAVFYPRSVGPS